MILQGAESLTGRYAALNHPVLTGKLMILKCFECSGLNMHIFKCLNTLLGIFMANALNILLVNEPYGS